MEFSDDLCRSEEAIWGGLLIHALSKEHCTFFFYCARPRPSRVTLPQPGVPTRLLGGGCKSLLLNTFTSASCGLPPRVALSDRVSVLHTEAEEGAVVLGIESPWPQTCNRFQDPDSSLMSYHQREVVVGYQTTMTTTWSLASDELASKGTLWRCVRNTSPTQPIASAATAENPVSCKGDNVEKNTAQKTVKMTQKNLENGDDAPP